MDRETKQNRKRHRDELLAQRMREDAARAQAGKPEVGSQNQPQGTQNQPQGTKRAPQPSGKPRLPD